MFETWGKINKHLLYKYTASKASNSIMHIMVRVRGHLLGVARSSVFLAFCHMLQRCACTSRLGSMYTPTVQCLTFVLRSCERVLWRQGPKLPHQPPWHGAAAKCFVLRRHATRRSMASVNHAHNIENTAKSETMCPHSQQDAFEVFAGNAMITDQNTDLFRVPLGV